MKIAKDLLPVKAHYFFFFAALGPLLPQMNVFGRQLGVSPAVMGAVTAVLPILWALAKPLVGFLVDFFQNQRKLIFMGIIMLMSGSYCSLYFLPEPPSVIDEVSSSLRVNFTSSNSSNGRGYVNIVPFSETCDIKDESCLSTIEKTMYAASCQWLCQQDNSDTREHQLYITKKDLSLDFKLTDFFYKDFKNGCDYFDMKTYNVSNGTRDSNSNSTDVSRADGHSSIDKCLFKDGCAVFSCVLKNVTSGVDDEYYLYGTVTFWGFVILMCLGTVAFNVANCIGDAVCFDVLGPDRSMSYGWQRAWGTAGYGLTALVAGWAVDMASGGSARKDFTPAFILTIIFTFVDMFFCKRLKLPSMSRPSDARGTLSELLQRPSVLIFLLFAVIVGMFDSFIIYYMFWFLEELATETGHMGSIKLLEGLTVAAESFGGELIFFAISGKILKRFGFGHTLTFCMACYALRLFLISLITNPWHILGIELVMQGPTYALCYSTIVGYAAAVAPPGLSATLQGIVAGMDDGFGFTLGSMLGGVMYKYIGGRESFHYFSVLALLAAILHAILHGFVFKTYISQSESTSPSEPEAEMGKLVAATDAARVVRRPPADN